MSKSRIKQAEDLLRECAVRTEEKELHDKIHEFLNQKPEPFDEHKILLDQFSAAFKEHFQVGYVASFGTDLKSAKTLLQATGLKPEAIVQVAKIAWTNGQYWGPKATTLLMLSSRWPAIIAENAQLKKSRPDNLDDKFIATMGGS